MTTEVMLDLAGAGSPAHPLEAWCSRGPGSVWSQRHTLKGWGLQAVSVLGILATLTYFGTLLATPWLGFHIHWLFIGFTAIYAVERAVTVHERGWRVSLLSMTVVGEWAFDIFLQMCQIKAIYTAVRRTARKWGA